MNDIIKNHLVKLVKTETKLRNLILLIKQINAIAVNARLYNYIRMTPQNRNTFPKTIIMPYNILPSGTTRISILPK
jgi:hypothetical protein